MKKCELCNKVARTYCESDEASLCWGCDLRVHTANFIVAKHTRTLLCHSCQCPTPWTGSGTELGPTVSVCEACTRSDRGPPQDGDEEDEENGDLAQEDEDEDDDDDDENQVVPLSLAPSTSTCTSSGDSSTSTFASSRPTMPAVGNVTEREDEKNGARKMRSWMWR